MINKKKILQQKIFRHISNRVTVQKKFFPVKTYEKYLNHCKSIHENTDENNTILEKHHILPKSLGGTDESSNIMKLTPRQHILAHLLRYLELGNENDRKAYIFRIASKDYNPKNHGQRMVLLHRARGTSFWDSETQRKLGKRGGLVGGSRNTKAQFDARSKVGQTWGKHVGMTNQSIELKESISKFLLFSHKNGTQVLVSPSETGAEVFEKLHKAVHEIGQ